MKAVQRKTDAPITTINFGWYFNACNKPFLRSVLHSFSLVDPIKNSVLIYSTNSDIYFRIFVMHCLPNDNYWKILNEALNAVQIQCLHTLLLSTSVPKLHTKLIYPWIILSAGLLACLWYIQCDALPSLILFINETDVRERRNSKL